MRSFFAFVLLFTLAAPVWADSLFDEGRLQSIVERQAAVLVRVKASVEIPAEEKPADAAADAQKTPDSADAKADTKTDAKAEPKTFLRLGTGFFITADGQIVTNASVVDGAKRLWYEVDGVAYLAEVKGIDVPTNIALLQAKTMPKSFATVNLADSVTLPSVGTFLTRLALPLEFPATPTVGIVQGADTQFGTRAFPTRYLRVQMNTGPGEAGAPVFDLQGRFVGVNVAVLPELGASYLLPARALSWVREGLASSGGHTYSYFGFNVEEEHSPDVPTQLTVRNLEESGPAAKSGLKVGDVVLEAGRKPTLNISDLRDAAFYTKAGQYLDLKVRRGGKDTSLSIQAEGKK